MRATPEQYLANLQALLPQGAAWPRDPEATMTKALLAMADGLADAHNRAEDLIEEADPRTTLELLEDWERLCGLPDAGASLGETIAARRAAVVARLTATGGQSRAYFIALAAAMGFAITITEYRVRLHKWRHHGELYGGPEMQFVWLVAPVDGTFRRPRRHGQARHAEPFTLWTFTELVQLLQRLKPAHTNVLFQ